MEIEQSNNMAEGSAQSARQRTLPKRCVELHRAALKGDWQAADELFTDDCTLINARITGGGETALHIAAVEGHTNFVDNLLQMNEINPSILNRGGCTALCLAATAGHLRIAEMMVQGRPYLPTIRGNGGKTPLYMAAHQGHNEMAKFLFPSSDDFQQWSVNDQIELLTASIDSGLYGIALKIVEMGNDILAVREDIERETPLQVLARKPLAFCDSSRQRIWGNIASTMLRWMKLKAHKTSPSCDAYKLLVLLWGKVKSHEDVETGQISKDISQLLLVAAESGNDVFLVELIRRYPDSLYKLNNSQYSIFHIAVLYRHVKVFNLIYELHGFKNLMLSYRDQDKNNILHLAAKLAPPNQLTSIPGAALQMQREVLWYKEVEKIVHPSYRNMKNKSDDLTPYDLFLKEHKNLMEEGEKQIKRIANSCMLVAILIATVIFAAAFTVPGGYNDNGDPNLQHRKLYIAFPISEVVAILSSLTSILMFLSILISHFSDNDFLWSLPFWLVVGVVALFVSIMAMMVAFSTSILLYQHKLAAIISLLLLFASVPILFVILKYPVLVTILRSTYSSKWIFGSNNRLFS